MNCEIKLNFSFTTQNCDSNLPDNEEFKNVIISLKNNKASGGEDGIFADLWKLADEEFRTETTKLFHKL